MKAPSPPSAVSLALAAALGLALLLSGAELGGWLLLCRRAGGSPYSLFFQARLSTPAKKSFYFPLTDPLLGWGRQPPFQETCSSPVPETDRARNLVAGRWPAAGKRIIGLGGSTTDPVVEGKNWVSQLAEQCGRHGLRCQTLNGGISGYSSTQELLKLMRDVLPLEPDLVLSLNGINDEARPVFGASSFVNNFQREIDRALRVSNWDSDSPLANPPPFRGLFPHARLLLEAIAFAGKPRPPEADAPIGVDDGYSASRRWEANVRMMHALAGEFGFRYFVVLQPHLALEPGAAKARFPQIPFSYDEQHLLDFYAEAGAFCRRLSYCADLSHEFVGKPEIFKDLMHLNAEGHALEAEKIFSILRGRGFL